MRYFEIAIVVCLVGCGSIVREHVQGAEAVERTEAETVESAESESLPETAEPAHSLEETAEVVAPRCAQRTGEIPVGASAHVTLQVWAEGLVQEVADALQRSLCVVALENVRARERRLSGNLSILDQASGEVQTVLIIAGYTGSDSRATWRPWHLPGRIAASFAIRFADEWLSENAELLGATRREINQGLHFLRLQRSSGTRVCLQWRHERGSGKTWCWTERGSIVRAVDTEFEYTDGDLEHEFAGFLALEDDAGTVSTMAVRFPQAEQAPARGLGISPERERHPPWFPNEIAFPPYRPIPTRGWRPFPAEETEHLGPLSFVRVTPLGDGVLGLESDGEHRVCLRYDVWVCSEPESRRESGSHASWFDAFRIDETRVAVMMASLPDNRLLLEAQPGGELHLKLFSRGETGLVANGSVLTGSVSWTSASVHQMQVERSSHEVQPESGCLRFEPARTDSGPVNREYESQPSPRTRPTLVSAGARVPFGSASEVRDMAGLWQVEATGLRRTQRCLP